MPSPNGYLTAITASRIDRSWARGKVSYDLGQPPWPPNPVGYRLEYMIGNSATGPWRPAPLTDPVSQCDPRPDNFTGLEQADGVTIGVGGTGGAQPPQADTDYWIRILVHDPSDTVVDDWVQGPFRTAAYPTVTCAAASDVTETSADVFAGITSGRLNITPPCNQDGETWEIATSPTGPWTPSNRTLANDLVPEHTFSGLTPDTLYYYRLRLDEMSAGGGEYLVSDACSFRTQEAPMTTPTFDPQPCCADSASAAACGQPIQFCQTGTSTAPVQHPGRMYDITLPVNPGFGVDSLQVDQVTSPAGITWEVDDPDGERFRTDLTAFMESRLPPAAVVTITNPNAGVQQVCGTALAMHIHIECLRLDQNPPNLIELVYNGGQDLIQNPAYNEFPPLNPPVGQGNYGFHLLARQDDSPPWPGNPPANRVLCTSVAGQGWQTNDIGRTFEIWGHDQATGQNVTPTPRGTPVQEMTSDGAPAGKRSTIWQTFTAPSSGNFIIRVVHGSRDPGEQHRITLSNGVTGDNQVGDLIDDITTPASVTSNGGPNPWTQFNQTIPLNGGSTYTLALSSTNPVLFNRGGLFTDMRAYLDRPGLRATATTDDDTCTVTVDETSTTTICSFWSPKCTAGVITDWTNVETGQTLTNTQFWAQTPKPSCCTSEAPAGEGGGQVNANLAVSDVVCATVGGIQQNAVRQVVLDPSGGQLSQIFLTTDGQSITPDTWTPGPCTTQRVLADVVLCDVDPGSGATVGFLRKYVQTWSPLAGTQVTEVRDFVLDGSARYTVTGSVRDCSQALPGVDREVLCDTDPATGVTTTFLRQYVTRAGAQVSIVDTTLAGAAYTTTGLVGNCDQAMDPIATTGLCLADGTPIAVVTRRDSTTLNITQDGWINLSTGAFSAGLPPAGTASCSSSQSIQTSGVFCSVDNATQNVLELIVIEYHYAADGSIESVRLVNATTGATYTVPPGASVTVCPTGGQQSADRDIIVLCDDNGGVATPFVRDFARNNTGAIIGHTDYTLANAPYTPTGTVGFCTPNTRDSETTELCDVNGGVATPFLRTFVRDTNGAITATLNQTLNGAPYTPTGTVGACSTTQPVRDSESEILCDSAAPTPNRFIRTRVLNELGAVVATVDTTLAGAPFTPTGAVQVCPQTVQSDTDFVEEVLCDSNGTAFIRLFRFNSATGALISTTNTTLAGAAFTPVGTVGTCSNCCPQVIGEGCTNTGSGRYTALRLTNGTISLVDSVTGAAVTQANIVACPGSTAVTLSAQHRLVADADAAWTPGSDVTGVLTSVTYTVLSGTATVLDQNGTSATLPTGVTATWNAADGNTLSGPQSIDAIGGQTYVLWTQR